MEKQAVITATDLCIGYRTHKEEKKVHEHLSFELYPGELTSLLGANGAGKSTLLRTLSASQPSLAGDLQLLDKPLQHYSEKERSRTIGVVLTDKTQAGGLTVYELVALGRQPHTGFFGRLHRHDHAIIQEALNAVGITHKAQSYTAELSDGERQKVMIAKALAQQTPIILLDEPTAFLDFPSKVETLLMLKRLAHQLQKSILISTHDVEIALQLADKIWLMEKLSANQEETENHNEEDHHDKKRESNSVLSVGTPQELADKGALSHFLDTPEITFDKRTMRIHFSCK